MEKHGGLNTRPFSSASYSIVGKKPRQQLTEAEKEARWVRRILANRESARQTILRRQAKFAELTRKTAELEMENENLKRERELAVSEYRSLTSKNEHLKAQIHEAKMKKKKLEEEKAESFDLTAAPSVVSNQYSGGPNWQGPNGSVELLGSENGVAAIIPMAQIWMPNVEHTNSTTPMIAHPGNFLYVLPIPILYPYTAPITTHDPNDSLVHELGSIQEMKGVSSSLPMKLGDASPSSSFADKGITGVASYNNADFQTEETHDGLRINPNQISNETAAKARKRRKEFMKLKNLC